MQKLERRAHLCHCCWETKIRVPPSYFGEGRRGSGVLSLCFSCCLGLRQRVKQDASFHVAPLPTPLRCFLCPLQSAWSATWVMTTPGTLLPRCHWISCWHQAHILQILFSAHILTLSSLQNRKSRWEKIDQGPGKPQKKKKNNVSKCFLCNNFYPSHTFLLKATLLGTQKWVFLFGNNSRRASEATVKLLQSRCFFLSPINLTPTPPLSSLTLALAHQF